MAETSTLARPYAKAAFDYALSAGQLAEWSRQLSLLAALAAQPKVAALIASPSLTAELQAQVLIDLCGDELSAGARNFVHVLATNRRIALLADISALYELHKANQEKSIDVDLASAYPLEEALREQLAAALKKKLQRDVSLRTTVDPSLLGGVLIRAGDVVLDDSVRGRLAKLSKAMNS